MSNATPWKLGRWPSNPTGSEVVADEGHDERGGRMIVDVVGGTHLLDLAIVQDGDAVGEFKRLFLVVRHGYRGMAGPVV
ncbi:MAG: hypothetical protein JSR91_12365 [Proteobacteria bacterium]|nr:hypothetical protein [Pseudomonadota bacterium]